ncbi:DUF2339 domain-containing protein [Roseinatronobacter monicus]|uniref:Putative membrane protein n=1 Tax=Roseinatronobacter monicus TaxID=393481 RepID=A0A543K5N6_9RHOB|nr:DUF2339 domain-containing protein [Roseinatronobacter monicus]TQM90383.1 putative membrane protein [Roseinatronobacter monicus]
MEFLLTLISVAALWIALSSRTRIKKLEQDLATLRAQGVAAETDPVALTDVPATPAPDIPAPETSAQKGPWGVSSRNGATKKGSATTASVPKAGAKSSKESTFARLRPWLRDNWIYPVAGAALVLSGVFLVQYAVETGKLTPLTQIVLALVLAAGLVAAGEWLRPRPVAGPVLPATLTGAGLVIAMAAVLAALHLYAMIGPATALACLAILSFAAIGLGWLYGPMLSALGLAAGTLVPFVLGGGGPPPAALLGYFALLALAGLGIDAKRRWGWVTWLALAGPLGAMVIWRMAGADELGFALAVIIVAGAAMTLPFGYIAPMVQGPRALGRVRPAQGVRASFVASAVAGFGLALLVDGGMAGPIGIAALAILIAVWCLRAPALSDQMVLPILALPLWIVVQAWLGGGSVVYGFHLPRPPESPMPLQASYVLGLALLAGLAMIWRGEAEAPDRYAPFTLAGLILPGGALVALETMWQPANVIGPYAWALHAMAAAGLATMLALRYAARDNGQGPRLGAAAAAAFAFVGLGMMLLLGQAALTIALAVLMVAAAAMDRRFDIPGIGAFMVLASLALGWRLVLDPGITWHLDQAHSVQFLASIGATLAGPFLALWLMQRLADVHIRREARLVVETGLMGSAAVGAGLVIARLLPDQIGPHAQLGLQAGVLIALTWVQVRRAALPLLQRVRKTLAWLLALWAAVALVAAAIFPASPLVGIWPFWGEVAGWPVLNDLLLAYLFPALLLLALARARYLQFVAWGLCALWVATAIRHLWQGPDLRLLNGIAQGELYAYTFALLLAGAVALAWALHTRRPDLRKLGVALAGLAAAKAFLVDASELEGLLRVGAFLGLGLTLAGLAWLNGWVVAREGTPEARDT